MVFYKKVFGFQPFSLFTGNGLELTPLGRHRNSTVSIIHPNGSLHEGSIYNGSIHRVSIGNGVILNGTMQPTSRAHSPAAMGNGLMPNGLYSNGPSRNGSALSIKVRYLIICHRYVGISLQRETLECLLLQNPDSVTLGSVACLCSATVHIIVPMHLRNDQQLLQLVHQKDNFTGVHFLVDRCSTIQTPVKRHVITLLITSNTPLSVG